jgi:hypothetical protein
MKRAGIALVLAGCASHVWSGADRSSGAAIEATRADMPSGHSFSGTYDSTEMGKPLELMQEGENVTGKWTRSRPPDNDCTITGSLTGRASANLIEFTWQEDHSACGESTVAGRGWALYRIVDGDDRPRLFGKRGLMKSEDDQGPWQAIKMP